MIVLDRSASGAGTAALMVDGQLEDLICDPADPAVAHSGDILLTRIARVLPNGKGAFAEIGHGQTGFFRSAKGLRAGDAVLAQVGGLSEPEKAIPLSAKLLFKGPKVILTPGAPGVNVSRRIGNSAERARLEGAVRDAIQSQGALHTEQDLGAIVRTSARDATLEMLTRETGRLLKRLSLAKTAAASENFGYRDPAGGALQTALREWVTPAPDAIIAAPELAEEMGQVRATEAEIWDPELIARIRREAAPLVASGAVEAMDALFRPDVPLSPGSMTIEPTRALVSVDVNTKGDFSPAAGLKTNLAAARELPRQLRLRGLGGQVAVDFAPMPKQQRRALEEALAKAFRSDPVETALVGWTRMGLFELQRKRERHPPQKKPDA